MNMTIENNVDEPITENVVVSVNKDGREISLLIIHDNRDGFIQNRWITELLIDRQQVNVPEHTYAEQLVDPTTDSTAIARYSADITHSTKE
jgi:hypothetical protein